MHIHGIKFACSSNLDFSMIWCFRARFCRAGSSRTCIFWHRKYKKRVEQGFKQDLHSHMPGFSHRVLWKMCFFFSGSFRRRLRSQKSLGSCEIRLQIVQNRSSAADPSVFIIGSRYYPPLAHASITAASWYKSDGGNFKKRLTE